MKSSFAVVVLAACTFLGGCAGGGAAAPSPAPAPLAVRYYNGTASVGDFLTISLDSTQKTLSYVNRTNGENASVPFTTSADGTYTFNDPTGNLVRGYEVPGYALMIEATKTGPGRNTASLITAVESGQVSLDAWLGRTFNYMQFRTSNGGIEAGSVNFGSKGVNVSSYGPSGAMDGQSRGPFNNNVLPFPASTLVRDPSGTFFTFPGQTDTVFGTAGGIFIVDNSNGAIMGFEQAATPNFLSVYAGSYKSTLYVKTNVSSRPDNSEAGTPGFSSQTISVDTAGTITFLDPLTGSGVTGSLTPFSTTAYLNVPGGLSNACNGFFAVRFPPTTALGQEDVFVTFLNNAMLIGTFRASLNGGNTYAYAYGVGLK